MSGDRRMTCPAPALQVDAGAVVGDIDPYRCRALWCGVIAEALKVALTPRLSDHPVEVQRTRNWFATRDFVEVCDMAGVDAGYVRRGVAVLFRAAGIG